MSELTPYGQMIETIDNLALVVTAVARSRGLSMRQVAEQSGVVPSTLSRINHGKGLSVENIVALLRWLDDSTAKEASE